MRGSKFDENPTDQMCDNCGAWYSKRGIKPHERNCTREEPIYDPDRPLEEGGLPKKGAPHPPDKGGAPSEDEGIAHSPPPDPKGDSKLSTPADREEDQDVATDGAGLDLEGPPETSGSSTASTSSRDPTVDDLPERYVSVEKYLEAVREETHGVDVDELAAHLEEYDVVDVEETTEEKIAAYPLEEVAG